MGLFNRRASSISATSAAVEGPSTSSSGPSAGRGQPVEPPSYENAKTRSASAVRNRTSREPSRFSDTPFAQELVFPCPAWPPDDIPNERIGTLKNKQPAGRESSSNSNDRQVTVTLSIPKASYNAGSSDAGKAPTMDVYFHLEYPGDELLELVVEATYSPYAEPCAEKSDQPKGPWFITSTLAAALINRDVALESKGRFTNKATWTLRPDYAHNSSSGSSRPWNSGGKSSAYRCLDNRPQAICATSAYFGPCTVTLRVGVKHDKYSNSNYITTEDATRQMVWRDIERPILFDGQSTDFISPYLHSVNSVKLLQ